MSLQINTSYSGMAPARRTTLPSRSLFALHKPLRYVPSANTDVARTFEKHRRLVTLAKAGLQ